MAKLKPVTPGELLFKEFLAPVGITRYRLAKEIGVPAQRIGEIVAGKRAITADTDLRLCRFFGLSNGYWLRAQAAYDTEIAEEALAQTLAKIKPWRGMLRNMSGKISRKKSGTDWEYLASKSDKGIDFSDIPKLGPDFWRKATLRMPQKKKGHGCPK